MKKSDLLKKLGTRRIAAVVEGTYNNLPAYKVDLEGGASGFFAKERFEAEAKTWPEDTDGTILLPDNYRLSTRGYWTPFERPQAGTSAFKLVGEA